ncbi:MAG: hypothetical protein JW945_05625 [Methanomicrobia archaeon]|nr:hypothetical protein [Methanomicrobia archaeon]
MSRLALLIVSLLFFFSAIVASGAATTVTIGEYFSETDVTAPIMINDVEELAAATIKVSYDPAAVVVTAIDNGVSGSFIQNSQYAHDGWVKMAWYLVDGSLNGDVTFALLAISPSGSYGDYSDLEIEVETLSDTEYQTIDADIINGFVYRGMNGDVNADRVIDAADSQYIANSIAGILGYPSKFGPSEVSGDGTVDAYDCVYLARHATGVPGYEHLK